MDTYQSKVLAEFERIAKRQAPDSDCATAAAYANTGDLYAQVGFRTVARLSYQFSRGHNIVRFNGSHMSVLWAEHEDDKVTAMFDTWSWLVTSGTADLDDAEQVP